MLKEVWRWYLYVECGIFRLIILAICLCAMVFSMILLRPSWESLGKHHLLNDKSDHAIVLQQSIPWFDLARKYNVAIKQAGDEVYFAGNAESIKKLLVFALSEYSSVASFRLEKNDYKTLLVVSQ